MILSLPYPPAGCTGNHATKHANGAHYTTSVVKRYRTTIAVLARQQGAITALTGPLQVVAEISPPDRRKRDLDNVWKTLADSLTLADVWVDDFQINDLRLLRGQPVKGGAVNIMVEQL